LDKRNLECDEAGRFFERLMEGDLGLGEEEILRAHIEACPACGARYALDLALVESIKAAPADAFQSVAGAVVGRVRVRERRRWALRWGGVVAAVCLVALATWQSGVRVSEPLLSLLTGSFKASPTYLALSKVGGLVFDAAMALRSMVLSGTAPAGLGSYAPQMALLALAAGSVAVFMMYGMQRWLRKPMEVKSWRNG
jgi:anti-sigma factor RsiW